MTVTNTNAESTDRLQLVPSGVYTIVGSDLMANAGQNRILYGRNRYDSTGD